jgi:hypothetical protein
MRRVKKSVVAIAVVAIVAGLPSTALAATCWNVCTILVTEWMNEGGHSYEEAAAAFDDCLDELCQPN